MMKSMHGHVLVAALGVAAAAQAAGPASRPALLQLVHPVDYEITQRITVSNGDFSAIGLLELNLAIPLDWPEQAVRDVRITGDRTFRLDDVDRLGRIVRSVYRPPGRTPAPGESRFLETRYHLTRYEVRSDAPRLIVGRYPPYDKRHRDFRLFTRSEKSIEADATEIVALASRLRVNAPGPCAFARAAYDYVIDHTQYATPSPAVDARTCLASGRGDCGAYTLLFVAICRAGGVPARPIAGCWAAGVDQWHCWAEFLLPEVGWVPVDPSVGDRGPREREYYFGNLDNNRVALAKTFNLAVRTHRGSRDVGFVQVGTWWWFPAPGATGARISVAHHLEGRRVE